eukprot:m.134873 g.134873  ORF g.134873 m.134873 type:complete len:414 (-) comp13889_c0_seq1:144-1385(-)
MDLDEGPEGLEYGMHFAAEVSPKTKRTFDELDSMDTTISKRLAMDLSKFSLSGDPSLRPAVHRMSRDTRAAEGHEKTGRPRRTQGRQRGFGASGCEGSETEVEHEGGSGGLLPQSNKGMLGGVGIPRSPLERVAAARRMEGCLSPRPPTPMTPTHVLVSVRPTEHGGYDGDDEFETDRECEEMEEYLVCPKSLLSGRVDTDMLRDSPVVEMVAPPNVIAELVDAIRLGESEPSDTERPRPRPPVPEDPADVSHSDGEVFVPEQFESPPPRRGSPLKRGMVLGGGQPARVPRRRAHGSSGTSGMALDSSGPAFGGRSGRGQHGFGQRHGRLPVSAAVPTHRDRGVPDAFARWTLAGSDGVQLQRPHRPDFSSGMAVSAADIGEGMEPALAHPHPAFAVREMAAADRSSQARLFV